MSFETYLLDAVELVLHEDYADALDDSALSAMVISTATYLAHLGQD